MHDESFRVEDGFLVHSVQPASGKPYEHRCPLSAFEQVAHAVDDLGGDRTTLEDLVRRTGLPWTQANVAFAFMKERGCVAPRHGRKHAAATGDVYLDAMTEYHALREPVVPPAGEEGA